jgi:hypothetical protein
VVRYWKTSREREERAGEKSRRKNCEKKEEIEDFLTTDL